MEQSIGDILNNEQPQPETVAEPEAQTEQPETVERPRGPDGKFISKETGVENEQPAEAEAAPEPVPPTEPTNQLPREVYEPLKEERRKRQALEDEVRQMREQFARLQQQPQQPQQPPVDFWDDPQSFMEQRFNSLSEQLLQQWEQRQTIQRIDASEKAARAKHADYDEAYRAFEQAVQTNPRLAYELAQAENPGEFAYAKGKTALEIQRVGSLDDLRAQIRAELEAEARQAIQPRPTLPSTTAADGSVGGRSAPAFAGPTPLNQLLGS